MIGRRKKNKSVEREVENINHEKTVSECKKLLSLIQKVVKRNTTFIYPNEYDYVMMEYGKIVKGCFIPKSNGAVLNEVWSVYIIHKVPVPNINFYKWK